MQNHTHPAETLAEELAAARNLVALLKREQNHLVTVDVEGLDGVTEEKSGIVMRMTELALRRHRVLAVAGFDGSETGMQAWMNSANANPDHRQSWTELLEAAQQAKELNRANGVLLTRQMSRNQAALNVLRRTQPGGAIYGPDGQSSLQPAFGKPLIIG